MYALSSKSLTRILPALAAFGLASSSLSSAFAAPEAYALATCATDQGNIAIEVMASRNVDGVFEIAGFSFRKNGSGAVRTGAGKEDSNSWIVTVADASGTPHYAMKSYRSFSLEGTLAPVKSLHFSHAPASGADYGSFEQVVSVDGTRCATNADNALIVLASGL